MLQCIIQWWGLASRLSLPLKLTILLPWQYCCGNNIINFKYHDDNKFYAPAQDTTISDGWVQERCNSIANALELSFFCTNLSDGLVQERRNSIANALELSLFCTSLSDGLVQERRNSIANALELCLFCPNLSSCSGPQCSRKVPYTEAVLS